MCKEKWYITSAEGKVLGRLAVRIASVLMGKDSPEYYPGIDPGNHVIVTDAESVVMSGSKDSQKGYFFPSRRPGKSKTVSAEKIRREKPEYIIMHAVKGMLPKNKLSSRMLKRLRIYAGNAHPHAAQTPADLEV
jgi:large subunit ribosomal protein L13